MKTSLRILAALYFITGLIIASTILYDLFILDQNNVSLILPNKYLGYFLLPAIIIGGAIEFVLFWVILIFGGISLMGYSFSLIVGIIVFIFTGTFEMIFDPFNIFGYGD
jgi:hypothetical protein